MLPAKAARSFFYVVQRDDLLEVVSFVICGKSWRKAVAKSRTDSAMKSRPKNLDLNCTVWVHGHEIYFLKRLTAGRVQALPGSFRCQAQFPDLNTSAHIE